MEKSVDILRHEECLQGKSYHCQHMQKSWERGGIIVKWKRYMYHAPQCPLMRNT